jgi:hypothetical protein
VGGVVSNGPFPSQVPDGSLFPDFQDKSDWYPDIQPFNILTGDKVTPGYGQPHPVCGEVRFKITCPQDPSHYQALARHTCHRPACPTCFPSWAARAAKSAVEVLEGYRQVTNHPYTPRHITISPDPRSVPFTEPTQEALQWLYDEGRKAARVLGVVAAVPIPHSYRIRPDQEAAIQEAATRAGMNRYEYALSLPNWRDLVYFSPHIHMMAYGRLMPSDEFHDKTTWVYHNHDAKKCPRSPGKTLYYLLTHAWVLGNHKIVRYWFGMSTHALKRVSEPSTTDPIPCPSCGTDCVMTPPDVTWNDGSVHAFYQDLYNAPTAYRKTLHFHFEKCQLPRRTSHDPNCKTPETLPKFNIALPF